VASVGKPSSLPTEPLLIVHPVSGETLQSIAIEESHEKGDDIDPGTEVLLTNKVVPTQMVSVGAILKLAIGGKDTLIGTTDPLVTPHGFDINIFAENEFGKSIIPLELVVPQEERVKRCVIESGGGWLKTRGALPSLKVMV
jgi:hypothetical protein